MAFRLFVLVLLSAPFVVRAHNDCPEHKKPAADLVMKAKGCPNNDQIESLCAAVGNGTEEDANSNNMYIYQTIVLNGSCVKDEMSDEQKQKQVQEYWNKVAKKVYCSNSTFIGGSVIKFGIHNRVDDFITDITKHWKLQPDVLNQPDKKDGRTVLDYVRDEIKDAESPAISQKLNLYYDKLKAAGAKHSK